MRNRPGGYPPVRAKRYNTDMTNVSLEDFSWKRVIAAVDAVRERAFRATKALRQAGIPHVVVGGNAVAVWVARVDIEAVRNTKGVDLLVRREDFPRVITALESAGFVYRHAASIDMFLDGPEGSARSAIHVVFAGEKVRPDYPAAAPDVSEAEPGPDFPVPTLDALVRMKLTSFRRQDQVHLLDLLDVGLVDESWCERLPGELMPTANCLLRAGRGVVALPCHVTIVVCDKLAMTALHAKARKNAAGRNDVALQFARQRRHTIRGGQRRWCAGARPIPGAAVTLTRGFYSVRPVPFSASLSHPTFVRNF